jgi:DNA-binding transcriptional regulator/RsmH inhibitor MraZ
MVNLRNFASCEQKLEENGRIKLTDELIKIAEIHDKVVLKGEGNFISIWNPEKYEQLRSDILKEHTELFDSLDYQR